MKTVVSGRWSVVRKILRLTAYGLQLMALFVLTSCAAPKVVKRAENGYLSVLEKWTREGRVYENFETKVLINATYKTREFRESYAAEYINTFMLDGEKGDELMKGEMEAPKKHHEFFLSIHTPNK